MKFTRGDIIKEVGLISSLGIILQSGNVSFDIVWIGGSTARYRYSTGRHVELATAADLEGMQIAIEHLQKEAAAAREERRTGQRLKRGTVSPRR